MQSPRLSLTLSRGSTSTPPPPPSSLGVTRSRTLLFLSYRESSTSSHSSKSRLKGKSRAHSYGDLREEEERLIGGNVGFGGDEDVELGRVDLPPEWVDLKDKVDELMESARVKISQLDRLYSKHVLPGFADRSAEEREIDILTKDVTSDFRKAHALIQKIGSRPIRNKRNEERMAKNVKVGMANKVQELSSAFRKKQGVYLRQLKGQDFSTQDLTTSTKNVPLSDSAKALASDVELSESLLTTQSLALADPDSETLAIRDREITNIAKSISDLADLFKDLSGLVIDQGSLLDRIDYNVEVLASEVESAGEELREATKYQKRSSKRSLIFLLLLLIFGAIIILIYKPRHSSASPSYPPIDIDIESPTAVDEGGWGGMDMELERKRNSAQRFLGQGKYAGSTSGGARR